MHGILQVEVVLALPQRSGSGAELSDRDWKRFKEFQMKFALDKETKTWVLVQKCSKGYAVRILAV